MPCRLRPTRRALSDDAFELGPVRNLYAFAADGYRAASLGPAKGHSEALAVYVLVSFYQLDRPVERTAKDSKKDEI